MKIKSYVFILLRQRLRRVKAVSPAFTIVELLVVIVVIGILAAITIVSFTGISQKAVASSIQSDLNNASKSLKLFQVDNMAYPTSISTNCSTTPTTTSNLCLKLSSGNSYIGYSATNSTSSQSFLLIAGNGSTNYKITNTTSPTLLAQLQSGVTPGASLELRAAKANGGISQGLNSPFTNTWTDTSGNGNNGTLTSFTGSPWTGVGSVANPYRLIFDGTNDIVALPNLQAAKNQVFTYEVWVTAFAAQSTFIKESGPTAHAFIRLQFAGQIQARVYNDVGGDGLLNAGGASMVDGLIHHLVWACGAGYGQLYLDGIPTGSPVALPGGTMTLGDTSVGGDTRAVMWLSGSSLISRIYPFALTATQVATNYAAGVN